MDGEGRPTLDDAWNPNGSLWAVEGITSPDGRVFGKMGHSERIGPKLYRNVPRKFATLRKHRRAILRELENAPAEALREDWGYEGPLPESLEARLTVWIRLAAEKLGGADINGYGKETLLSDLMLAKK